jgi:hypothetical protein
MLECNRIITIRPDIIKVFRRPPMPKLRYYLTFFSLMLTCAVAANAHDIIKLPPPKTELVKIMKLRPDQKITLAQSAGYPKN